MKKLSLLLMIPLLLSGCNKKMNDEKVFYNILTNFMEKYREVDKYEISMSYNADEEYIVQFDDDNNFYYEEYSVRGVPKESNYIFFQDDTIYKLNKIEKKGECSNYLDSWIETRNVCNLLLSTVISSESECLNYVKLYYEGNSIRDDFKYEVIDKDSINISFDSLDQSVDISIDNYLITNMKYINGDKGKTDIKINYDFDVVIPNIDDYDFSLKIPYIPF